RFYGPMENPRLRNRSTGKVIAIQTSIAAGNHVEVNTQTGDKSIRLYDGETHTYTSILHLVDFEASELWELKRGTNVVRFEADDRGEDSHVVIIYRQRYAGV